MYEGVFFVKKLFYVPGDDMALTDTWLRANLNKRVESAFEVSDRDGMSARVSSSGKIVFQVRFTHNKKRCRMDIGVYPVISLKQARESVIKIKGPGNHHHKHHPSLNRP